MILFMSISMKFLQSLPLPCCSQRKVPLPPVSSIQRAPNGRPLPTGANPEIEACFERVAASQIG